MRPLAALAALTALLALPVPARAQEKLDPLLRRLLERRSGGYRPSSAVSGPSAAEVSLLLRLAPGGDVAGLRARFPAARFDEALGGVVSGVVPLADLPHLAGDAAVQSASGSRPYKLSMDVVRSSMTVSGVWLGAVDAAAADLGTNLGQGVVVGFVDSGIDIHHPDFYTAGSPNQTRLLWVWDQTDSGGPAPGGFSIGGSEWTQAQLNAEISASPPGLVREKDVDGHGTHVAGIAAGNGTGGGVAGRFAGIASAADIIMVKSSLSDAGILQGVQYIIQKAKAAGKKAVINLSLGTQYGPHDGTSNLEVGLDAVAVATPVVVAMGNEQSQSIHGSATVAMSGNQTFNVAMATGASSAVATDLGEFDFWVPSGDSYSVTVGNDQTGTTVSCPVNTRCTLSLSGMEVDVSTGANVNGAKETLVDICNPGSKSCGGASFVSLSVSNWTVKLNRQTNGGSGRVDGWADVAMARFTSQVDNTGTVGSPATANNVIAVGAYCSKDFWKANDGGTYYDVDCDPGFLGFGAPGLGDISIFSNRGPTRDGRQKPDVAAPGQRIASALSADQSPGEALATVTPDGKHKLISGTSMAAPAVTGAVARSAAVDNTVTGSSARATLQSQARTDSKVTAFGAVPNQVFGYGKLDIPGCNPLAVGPTAAVPTTLGTSSISWTWSALIGATSYNVYYGTNTASQLGSSAGTTFVQQGDADTTTSIFVRGVNSCGTGPGTASAASTATLAVPLASFSATPFITTVTVSWTPLPASPQSASSFGYEVELSTASDFTGTMRSSATPAVGASQLTVSGLTGFTTYYMRVATLNQLGGPDYIGGTFTHTNTALVPLGVGPFSGVTANVVQTSWTFTGDPQGLEYFADISQSATFASILNTADTFANSAVFTGLSPNATYYFRVHPFNGPTTNLGSTITLANVPGTSAAPFPAVYQTSMSVVWNSAGNPAGTLFRADLAADAGFTLSAQSSVTLSTSAFFQGLNENTSYYLRVTALNFGGTPSAYAATQATSTLTAPPGATVPVFNFVGPSSASVNWSALPLTPVQNSCEGYLVQASTRQDFSAPPAQAQTNNPAATSLVVPGLLQDATYYFRVGALNWGSAPVFTTLGSTLTAGLLVASSTVQGAQPLSVQVNPSVAQLSNVLVQAPGGAFPSGTALSITATLLNGFPPPSSPEGTFTPVGPTAAVDISAGGAQPAKPVTLTFTYVPINLPAGADVRRLVIARFAGGGWAMLPTAVDSSAHTLTAQTDHFSLFAPFFVSPGTSLDGAQVFPVPWKPGSGDAQFDASGVTFSNLPADGEVRIYTILGELVADLHPNLSGIVLWDGNNKHSRRVASGTYVVVLSGAGSRRVLRVAVVR